MKYKIECPHCNLISLETNDNYDKGTPVNGSMFTLIGQYADAGWTTFPLVIDSQYDNITCPSCDGLLVDSRGYLLRKHPVDSDKEACPVCDKEFSRTGIANHIKFKHPEFEI